MKREVSLTRATLLLVFLFSAFSILNARALAQSSTVTANIPVGIILVQGKTSPNAQVKLYENGNDHPTASIIADANGTFSEELPQDAAGTVNVSIQATDTAGKQSELITKQVAVIPQQTSTLTVILPPTIVVNPASAVFQTGSLDFSGQTIPNANVKVTIEPSTIVTTTADSQGRYSIPFLVKALLSASLYTFGVEASLGLELSDYVIAGTFVITPPVQTPIDPPSQPTRFFNRFSPQVPPAPEILFPDSDEYMTAGPFVMTGKSSSGAIVSIYDEGVVIGSIVADENGSWQFYFSPFKVLHTLYATTCLGEVCSEKSREIRVRKSQPAACQQGITLKSYKLTGKTGEPVKLSGTSLEGASGIMYISWGDTTNERSDIDSTGIIDASHTYENAGIYSGYIIANYHGGCQTISYFSVEVSDNINQVELITLIGVIAIITILVLFGIRYLSSSMKK